MGQYVDIVGALSGSTQNASAEEFKEYFSKIRGRYLSAFQTIRTQLGQSYKYHKSIKTGVDIDSRITQATDKRDTILKTYASSKGGADILPEEERKAYLEKLQKNVKEKLKKVRKNFYSIKNLNDYKILAGKLMALIYQLKFELTGVEEKFAFIYQGSSGYAETLTVPVTQFLLNSNLMKLMNIQSGSISRWSGSDDHSLRFNSSVLKQMQEIYSDNIDDQILGKNFMQSYFNARELSYNKVVATKNSFQEAKQYQEESNTLGLKIYRADNNYLVVNPSKKYQRGFITQGLFGARVGDKKATFLGDTRKFYEDADIKSSSGELYSVKSFIDGQIPSLVEISTLYKVSGDIISSLQLGETDMAGMAANLSSLFNAKLAKIDGLANRDIDAVMTSFGI